MSLSRFPTTCKRIYNIICITCKKNKCTCNPQAKAEEHAEKRRKLSTKKEKNHVACSRESVTSSIRQTEFRQIDILSITYVKQSTCREQRTVFSKIKTRKETKKKTDNTLGDRIWREVHTAAALGEKNSTALSSSYILSLYSFQRDVRQFPPRCT